MAASMAVSAAPAVSGSLSSNLSIPAGAALRPSGSDLNSQSIQVADLLVTSTTSKASVYVPTGKVRTLSRRFSLADGSWIPDKDKVDLLTQLIKSVVV
jgi:hypothetical protein